ncbi:MAG TPA: flagellar hook-associated protein FlgL [Gammaproteobacteria bacterium]
MRISTAQIHTNGVIAIQRRQAELARTQQQLATGKRILTPADDPAGAVQGLRLRQRIGSVEQHERNAGYAVTRLENEEVALASLGNALQRARELAVQAASDALSDENRQSIAQELREISNALLDAANARDGHGEHLFGGYRTTARPFVRGPDGRVQYVGDGGRREVNLSPDRRIAVGDNGLEFMTIAEGNGVFTVTPDGANAGTGRVAAAQVMDAAAYNGESYTLVMATADTYEVRDGNGTVITTGNYAAGTAIDFGGVRVVLDGEPAAGDSFAVEPAGTVSLFAIVDDLAAALEEPAGTPAARALTGHAVATALQDLDQAIGRVLELRTGVGARLNTLEQWQNANADELLELRSSLSEIEDLDYAEAVSRFRLQEVALEAAQAAQVQLAGLSLFNFLD